MLTDAAHDPSWRTVALEPTAGADLVRLVGVDVSGAIHGWLAFSAPVVARPVALADLLPRDAPVALGWPLAFGWPCQRQPGIVNGITEPAAFGVLWGAKRRAVGFLGRGVPTVARRCVRPAVAVAVGAGAGDGAAGRPERAGRRVRQPPGPRPLHVDREPADRERHVDGGRPTHRRLTTRFGIGGGSAHGRLTPSPYGRSVLSPPRPATPPADLGARGTLGRARLVLAVGLLTALAALAFPFAPVRQPEINYLWTPADGTAVALPLMPYQPVELTATIGCEAARTGGLLLSTVPPRPDPAALPLDGLRLVGTPAGVRITSGGADLGTVALPTGVCTLALGSDATATVVALDGTPVLRRPGDVRPDVAGIFTDLPTATATSGRLALSLTADNRFTTTPSLWKIALAAICLAGLVTLFVLLAAADRALPRVRILPRGWWRPRPVDAVVTALLAVWWVIGSGTVDDGYIAGIVRSRGDNGFVGNVYRWLNAPEAPFSWFYEPYHWWSTISAATPWMRLPSTLLGLLCWFLVSRLLLPRLGRIERAGSNRAGSDRVGPVVAGRRRGSPPWPSAPGGCRWIWACGPSRGWRSVRC